MELNFHPRVGLIAEGWEKDFPPTGGVLQIARCPIQITQFIF